MKKINVAALSTLTIWCTINATTNKIIRGPEHVHKAITLQSPVIKIIDGKSWGIDGTGFGQLLQVRSKVRKLLYGNPQKDHTLIGHYTFQNEKYSMFELAQLEAALENQYLANKQLRNEGGISFEAWQKIESTYQRTHKELNKVLLAAKAEFELITREYLEGARGAKEQLLILIKESCEKHNHPDCTLLNWGKTEEGNEHRVLREEILDWRDLTAFCEDLTNFLEDLARSCPKAKEQFTAMVQGKK